MCRKGVKGVCGYLGLLWSFCWSLSWRTHLQRNREVLQESNKRRHARCCCYEKKSRDPSKQGRKLPKFKLFGECRVLKVIFWEEHSCCGGAMPGAKQPSASHAPAPPRLLCPGGGGSQTKTTAVIPNVSVLHLSCSLWV